MNWAAFQVKKKKKGSLEESVQREITTTVLVWIIYPQLIFKKYIINTSMINKLCSPAYTRICITEHCIGSG